MIPLRRESSFGRSKGFLDYARNDTQGRWSPYSVLERLRAGRSLDYARDDTLGAAVFRVTFGETFAAELTFTPSLCQLW